MSVVGMILQARMGSERLKGKIFAQIGSKTLLEYILWRLAPVTKIYPIVIATSTALRDDRVEKWCTERCIACFRGSEQDVLDRYYKCAVSFGFDHIVRLTGDNPFIDVDELVRLIELHIDCEADYTHSLSTLPVGVGSEVFTHEALEKSYTQGQAPNHREHVNEYIQENPNLFKISVLSVSDAKNHPEVRLTVDTTEDLERARRIIAMVSSDNVTTEEVIQLCLR